MPLTGNNLPKSLAEYFFLLIDTLNVTVCGQNMLEEINKLCVSVVLSVHSGGKASGFISERNNRSVMTRVTLASN